jgi:hypothetical protein
MRLPRIGHDKACLFCLLQGIRCVRDVRERLNVESAATICCRLALDDLRTSQASRRCGMAGRCARVCECLRRDFGVRAAARARDATASPRTLRAPCALASARPEARRGDVLQLMNRPDAVMRSLPRHVEASPCATRGLEAEPSPRRGAAQRVAGRDQRAVTRPCSGALARFTGDITFPFSRCDGADIRQGSGNAHVLGREGSALPGRPRLPSAEPSSTQAGCSLVCGTTSAPSSTSADSSHSFGRLSHAWARETDSFNECETGGGARVGEATCGTER